MKRLNDLRSFGISSIKSSTIISHLYRIYNISNSAATPVAEPVRQSAPSKNTTPHHYKINSMNLNRAFVLILASFDAVSGFAPNGHSSFSVSVASTYVSRAAYSPSVRVASTVFSEAEQAESSEMVVNEAPAFETAVYVGNISFGKFSSLPYSKNR